MNAPDKLLLPDVQSHLDERNIAINRVGVRAITHPVIIETPNGPMPSVATFDMAVYLPGDTKGTHMSRFLEVIYECGGPLVFESCLYMMSTMLERLESKSGTITVKFPYFIRKTAPISGVQSLLDYQVTIEVDSNGGHTDFWMTVMVPVTSLCPCSKKISEYGAHNQRSHITMRVQLLQAMPIEELVAIAERTASCELYGLLKRPDEKYVAERAYENPKFVEDLVRDLAIALNADRRVGRYRVESENFESIHNHSAVAWIEGNKLPANH